MPVLEPSLEVLTDNLIVFPYDVDLRKAVRDRFESQFADIYPDVCEQGIVLRASLLSLLGAM